MKKIKKAISKVTSVLKHFFTPERLEKMIETIIVGVLTGIVVQLFAHFVGN